MQNLDRLLKAIHFIETHLREELHLDMVAGQACYSLFHFHRLFMAMTGMPPGLYIRRRRLTEAALELKHTHHRILDIALDYQFQSQEAFSRAFARCFGCSPGHYRRRPNSYGMSLFLQPLTREQLQYFQGGIRMIPKIVEKDALYLVGVIYFGANEHNEISEMWEKSFCSLMNIPNRHGEHASFGLCFQMKDFKEKGYFHYMAAMRVTSLEEIPIEMVAKIVPARTYAVFTCTGGIKNIRPTYQYIYGTWLPQSGYEVDGTFDFEYYDERFNPNDEEHSELDIYIPLKPGK